MPDISLTDFIKFVSATGSSRITKVRDAKCRGVYDPRSDYWKQMREAIVAFHAPTNTTDKVPYFRTFMDGITNASKLQSFKLVSDNYKRFLGKKSITGLPVQKTRWTHNGLTVRVNPESLLNINGSRELYKLYFAEAALSKQKSNAILALMSVALPNISNVDQFAVYDGRNNRIIRSATPDPNLMMLVRGEADAFVSIWNEIECPPPAATNDDF